MTFSIVQGKGGGGGGGPLGPTISTDIAYMPRRQMSAKGTDHTLAHLWNEGGDKHQFDHASILAFFFAGLRSATEVALLNANYVAARIKDKYKVKYVGKYGNVAHELLVDVADYQALGLTVMDFAKRLMDYGFHPPTCSWPISTGLLIEITESEPFEEIDRLCDALLGIAAEAQEIRDGTQPKDRNLLKLAPHTIETLTQETWDRPYSRERAAYPVPGLRKNKFWPAVSRIDDAYGDRNLVCECGDVEEYASE